MRYTVNPGKFKGVGSGGGGSPTVVVRRMDLPARTEGEPEAIAASYDGYPDDQARTLNCKEAPGGNGNPGTDVSVPNSAKPLIKGFAVNNSIESSSPPAEL